ncbi:acetyl esterase/lipase [Sphingobium sp. B11D3B]|uniref:alpha/beta hydrolase family protein n=1 Tax=Sphingobium sp. B11D3B TaxID=2940575 RepID=UPI002225E401|nr:alpha/beta hydrolase [Sphingobium sp. B11D3B]MCW2389607.1 acetyl esterase/lipase [Sphingobium sp. B11D3B]
MRTQSNIGETMSAPPSSSAPHSSCHANPLILAASLPRSLPDARIRYSDVSPVQFADLRLPHTMPPPGGFPVVIFIHGGGWLADWTKDYSTLFVEALTNTGVATWDVEFRRMGHVGGGYPDVFHDVALAADHLREVMRTYPLDLSRVIAVGHSTGGHLALWLAGRRNLDPAGPLYAVDPLPLHGVVSIGGVNDLEQALKLGNRTDILRMLGLANPEDAAALFTETSPVHLLPLGIPQTLVIGELEEPWRIEMTLGYAQVAEKSGDRVRVVKPEDANHFDVIDPHAPVFAMIASEIAMLAHGISGD